MQQWTERALDYLTSVPYRIRSLLRLALIGLVAMLASVSDIEHWLPGLFNAILVAYGVVAVMLLAVVLRGPIYPWYGRVAIAIDVVFVVVLCIVSGAATVWLLPVFFLLPISAVYLESPFATAALTVTTAVGYLLAWFVYAVRDNAVDLPPVVYVRVGCLLWMAAALTGLSYAIKQRTARVENLLEVRRRLAAEVVEADERNNRSLSEQIHDGPLQNLLAARLDLEDLRVSPDPEVIDRIDAVLRDSVRELRAIVTTLHPAVLAHVGLTAGIHELIRTQENRGGIAVDAHLEEMGRPEHQAMLYRAVRELIVNAQRHSGASRMRVALHRTGHTVVLSVTDNGVGFDPDVLQRRVAEGHIGLASLMVGVDALEGSVDINTAPGAGTTVTVTLPNRPAAGTVPCAGADTAPAAGTDAVGNTAL